MRSSRNPAAGAERVPGAYVLPVSPSLFWLWGRRLGLAAALAFAIGYLPYRFYLRSGLSRYLKLQADLVQIRDKNKRLSQDNRHLREELDSLDDDDHAIERVARDELGLIRPGEIVFKVASAEEPPKAGTKEAAKEAPR